jgi:hypothetical protein
LGEFGKPRGRGGKCKRTLIDRVQELLVGRWESLREENIESPEAMEANAKCQ